ncbi:MAG: response regulator [Magnetococcales bacterium]|nr:response regulator [Magnetococcales bacterium]
MKTLLLVEDSRSFGAILKRRLEESLPVTVHWARRYAEAESLVQQQEDPFDLAVLDLNLPDAADGQIVDFILSQHIPAFVMTGEYKKETRTHMMAKGILDYFIKDHINVVDTLIQTIQRIDRNRQFTLLVVDDSRSTRLLLGRFLSRYGFRILEAASGQQALEQLGGQKVEMVLTDYHMPGMDGFQLTRAIRSRWSRNDVCIIGLSSQEDPDMAIHFIKAGANDFLTKSCQNEELLYRVLQNIEILEHNLMMEQQIRQRTNEIKEHKDFLENILGSALDAIITIDHNQKIVQFNPAAEILFGHTRDAVLGQDVDLIIPPGYRQRHRESVMHRLNDDGQFKPIYRRIEIPGLRIDGSCVDLDVGLTSVKSGGEVYYTAFMHDVTDRKQLMKSLKETLDVAESANKAKSDFLANMSHEIRTPLNAVIGLADLALQQELSPKILDYLNKISFSAKSLLRIINDILDFSKIEAGKLSFESSIFLLQDLFSHIHDLFHNQVVAKRLEWHLSLTEAYPSELVGDPLRLEQVLINLIGNAIKFTETGTVAIRVVTVQELPDQVTLEFIVQDSGIGMAQEQLSQLFHPFTQLDTSATRRFGGTGLGLSISQLLVQQMGGSIRVESEPGRGSLFAFDATFQRPSGQIKQQLADSAPRPQGYEPSALLQRMTGARILLVEDNAINRQVANEILTSAGLIVEMAEDGVEAVAKVNQSSFDLVLMDIQMPNMDGYQATRQIRGDARHQQLPIIAMTAHAMAEDRTRSLVAGMNDHVTKPIDRNRLFAALWPWIDRSNETTMVTPPPPPRRPNNTVGLLPELLDGIDLPSALERINGNQLLLRSLLLEFAHDFADADQKIAVLLTGRRQDDLKAAERLAHSVKGMAGNISAQELFQAALAMERAIREQQRQQWPVLLQQFRTSLAEVCRSIIALQPATAVVTECNDSSVVSTAIDWYRIRLLLAELEQQLKGYNVLAQQSLDGLKPLLSGTALQEPLQQIEQSLSGFDFEAALVHCNALLVQLEPEACLSDEKDGG